MNEGLNATCWVDALVHLLVMLNVPDKTDMSCLCGTFSLLYSNMRVSERRYVGGIMIQSPMEQLGKVLVRQRQSAPH
jgi:hypothetical protein